MNIVVNITSWVGISGGAEHSYAKVRLTDNSDEIYVFAKNLNESFYNIIQEINLEREIDEKEASYLNKKDSCNVWRAGKKTERFNSFEEIKDVVLKTYPNDDIIFTFNDTLQSIDLYVIKRTTENYIKTGKQLKICRFEGFSREFANLTEGSIHDIIKTPIRYQNQDLQPGYWVMGVTEPVLVLRRECVIIETISA